MNKCLVALLIILGLISCTKKDEHYYQSHPKELQQVLKECPIQQTQDVTCQQLQKIAGRMNHLAYQLQYSPQNFGNKILALQETIASQQQKLNAESMNTELQAHIIRNKKELAEHLAVVKWLESPAS